MYFSSASPFNSGLLKWYSWSLLGLLAKIKCKMVFPVPFSYILILFTKSGLNINFRLKKKDLFLSTCTFAKLLIYQHATLSENCVSRWLLFYTSVTLGRLPGKGAGRRFEEEYTVPPWNCSARWQRINRVSTKEVAEWENMPTFG